MTRSRALLNLGFAAFLGVILAGPGAAVFPGTLRWGAWAACPAGSTAAPERYVASFDRPGESQVRLLCVGPGSRERDRTLASIGVLALMYCAGLWVLFSLLALRGGGGAPAPARLAGQTLAVPAPVAEQARALHRSGQPVAALGLLREQTGMSLAQAKAWVAALARSGVAAPATLTPGDRLAELMRMHEAGLIDAAEFAAKKAEILAAL